MKFDKFTDVCMTGGIRHKAWGMVLTKFWVAQNFSRISRVSLSRFSSSYVRLTVLIFIRWCLGVSIFCKAKDLKVSIRFFVFF